MVDVKKLNSTIESLEDEVENIRKISRIVSDLEKLNNDVLTNNESSKDAISKIELIKEDLSTTISTYESFIEDAKRALEEINGTIDSRVSEIQKENLDFNKQLADSYKEMENDLLTQLQNIRNENKKLYLEFDEILSSKLDRNKSDIQVEIRNNSNEVITDIEIKMDSKILELENKIREYSDELNKKAESQRKFLIILTVLSIINIILKFI